MTGKRSKLVFIPLVAPLLAVVSACGGQAHPVAASAQKQQLVPAGSAAKAVTAGSPGACATRQLSLRLGVGGHAAGSAYLPIVFTNTGSAACTLTGYPGVSFVAPSTGKQVGAAATRNSHQPSRTVTLQPAGRASALLQVANYVNFPPKACAATSVSGLRVYPPGQTAAAYVPFSGNESACSSSVEQLSVQAVVSGATGGA